MSEPEKVKEPPRENEKAEIIEQEEEREQIEEEEKSIRRTGVKRKRESSEVFKVFIRNIPFDTDENVLKDMFYKCGKVKDAYLPRYDDTGRGKGYMFVTYEEQEGMDNALQLHGTVIGGRNLMIERARVQKRREAEGNSTSVYVGNVDSSIQKGDLEKAFSSCGKINEVRIPTWYETNQYKGFAFIEFEDSDAAAQALELDGTVVKGIQLRVRESNKKQKRNNSGNYNNNYSNQQGGYRNNGYNNQGGYGGRGNGGYNRGGYNNHYQQGGSGGYNNNNTNNTNNNSHGGYRGGGGYGGNYNQNRYDSRGMNYDDRNSYGGNDGGLGGNANGGYNNAHAPYGGPNGGYIPPNNGYPVRYDPQQQPPPMPVQRGPYGPRYVGEKDSRGTNESGYNPSVYPPSQVPSTNSTIVPNRPPPLQQPPIKNTGGAYPHPQQPSQQYSNVYPNRSVEGSVNPQGYNNGGYDHRSGAYGGSYSRVSSSGGDPYGNIPPTNSSVSRDPNYHHRSSASGGEGYTESAYPNVPQRGGGGGSGVPVSSEGGNAGEGGNFQPVKGDYNAGSNRGAAQFVDNRNLKN